ncbi:unnamed protein product [Parnassius apollo]|uniref:(apollo) hypothetical protein n=1 Tax=Parnassius apollo TaxID=110799 RepID=A0A8S3X6X0_PARAO|nr:unnamed protein product [Parnassius apollo]
MLEILKICNNYYQMTYINACKPVPPPATAAALQSVTFFYATSIIESLTAHLICIWSRLHYAHAFRDIICGDACAIYQPSI